ncbi:MAG: hypothetical protein GY847_41915 [Proteobacteria bacterium]|nr:hypothetical protein [Pseudomonadota bacterium]
MDTCPHCAEEIELGAVKCSHCDSDLVKQEHKSHDTALSKEPDDEVWREGTVAVTTDDSRFPDRCVRCNKSADGYVLMWKVRWVSPWLMFLIICPPLLFLLHWILSTEGRVHVGLCPNHRRWRLLAIPGAFFCTIAVLASFGTGVFFDHLEAGVIVSAIFLIILITIVIKSKVVSATKITDTHIWLNVGESFLKSLKNKDTV